MPKFGLLYGPQEEGKMKRADVAIVCMELLVIAVSSFTLMDFIAELLH